MVKKIVKLGIFLIIIGVVTFFKEPIAEFLSEHIIIEKKVSDTLVRNQNFENQNYQFVSIAKDFNPQSRQDLLNIIYTVLNAGMSEFTFYCNDTYPSCIEDIDAISNNRLLLSHINNFINPFNTFQDIRTIRYETTKKVTLQINYTYSKENQEKIDKKIDEVLKEKIQPGMTDEEKIKVIHDYIIENTKYDSDKSDKEISKYQSTTAYGPLFEGYGICSGYADTMKLFLTKLNIPSIKVASENHIWNLVYINNEWLHLDLTWDDPVLESGKEIIDYEYYLITTEELYNKTDKQHFFDKEIYKEAIK